MSREQYHGVDTLEIECGPCPDQNGKIVRY